MSEEGPGLSTGLELEPIPFKYWTSALKAAIRSEDHTVELVPGDRNGVQVEIDGIPALSGDGGYPWENFTLANKFEYWDKLTPEMQSKLKEVRPE